MSARSKRLGGPVNVAVTDNVVLYTCPAGKTAAVKSIRIVNDSSQAARVVAAIGASYAGLLVLSATVASKAQYIDPDTDPVVLHAGQVLRFAQDSAGGGGTVVVTVSGMEVDA